MKEIIRKSYVYVGITAITLTLIGLPMLCDKTGMLYGSEGDWYQQHVVIAESIRQTMLQGKTLFPQYIGLGGGSNIYDFAYYGLYRPDIVLSCLIPNVKMTYIIAGYSALGVIASGNLCYFWLKKQKISEKYAFIGAILLISGSCFYQAHHQIMFVNYMPFLILALIGTDKLINKGKSHLLILSLFLVYLHSFFYSFSCLLVWAIYYVYKSSQQAQAISHCQVKKAIVAVLVSIGLASILLLPAGIDILSTTKDGGVFAAAPMKPLDLTLEGLLYSPYGCGMSIFSLYLILVSLTRKGRRLLSATLLLCFLIPGISLVLNGFLYARAKVLIPFILLVVLLCADTLQQFHVEKKPFPIWPLGIFLIFHLYWEKELVFLLLVDSVLILAWICLQRNCLKKEKSTFKYMWIVLALPICISLGVNLYEEYLPAYENRQGVFSKKEITEFAGNALFRYDIVADKSDNCNVLGGSGINRTSMYSSVTNNLYGDFYYNTMKNPISIQNRVALLPDINVFFSKLMGVRYIMTTKENLPYGYKKVKEKGSYVLAENVSVLPVAYGKYSWISNGDYSKLEFPYNIEALCTRTVTKERTNSQLNSLIEEKKVQSIDQLEKLPAELKNKVLIINFTVKDPSGNGAIVTINGVKNKLSSKEAPYPNGNNEFTYIITTEKNLDKLKIEQSKGDYRIQNLNVYTMDIEKIKTMDIVTPQVNQSKDFDGRKVFDGSIKMKKDGYFVTSYPYANGYRVIADGKEQEVEIVNTAFVGFPLAKGSHKIEISFEAPFFITGASISLISIMVLIYIILKERKKRK